tara:strand:+ start:3195 stop:3407 length:213 start_codon:yes stop_codon:yes gene_type:complete
VPGASRTARQIIMEELNKEICLAMTADLQRAANFLKGAREVRAGSKKQRRISRERQATAYKRKDDRPCTW